MDIFKFEFLGRFKDLNIFDAKVIKQTDFLFCQIFNSK